MPDRSRHRPLPGLPVPVAALAACALASLWPSPPSGTAHAAEPQLVWQGAAPAAAAVPEAFCGQNQTGAPDIMTYNRDTGTQVDISNGNKTQMSALNRRAGASANVTGNLAEAVTPYSCDASALTRTGHALVPVVGGGAMVLGYDDATRRRYEVLDRRDGGGPTFEAADGRSGARVTATIGPDGRAASQTWNGRSLSSQKTCIRAAAQLAGGAGVPGNGASAAASISTVIGDCQ